MRFFAFSLIAVGFTAAASSQLVTVDRVDTTASHGVRITDPSLSDSATKYGGPWISSAKSFSGSDYFVEAVSFASFQRAGDRLNFASYTYGGGYAPSQASSRGFSSFEGTVTVTQEVFATLNLRMFSSTRGGTSTFENYAGTRFSFSGDGSTFVDERVTGVNSYNLTQTYRLRPGQYLFSVNGDGQSLTRGGEYGGYTVNTYGSVDFAPVPEPGTIAALGLGAAALLRRRRARKA